MMTDGPLAQDGFFPSRPDLRPMIYAYEDTNPQYAGLLKVGYTTKDPRERIAAQYPTLRPGPRPYRIVLEEPAMRGDGTTFTDHDVHRMLRINGIRNPEGEWFRCTPAQVKAAILAVHTGQLNEDQRTHAFTMRPEQAEAVDRTAAYFEAWQKDRANRGRPPHFLWNAKMRFGKTFTSYQLARRMGWRRLLVLTFKPAVAAAWEEDLKTHVDFKGWQFVAPGGLSPKQIDPRQPIVCFGSFQDYLGKNPSTGGIKVKNKWVHETKWDCIILDEYHFGAWREGAKELFEAEGRQEAELNQAEQDFDEASIPITAGAFLYLSGTPFRAIASGEFIEEQIFNWTYADEQQAKAEWAGPNNPYEELPRMVLLTYRLPPAIRDIAIRGEFNEFDLNTFFAAEGVGKHAKFVHQNEVQRWLDLVRGAYLPASVDDLKLGAKRPPTPFGDGRLLEVLTHTFWFLPSIASCHAMRNLLARRNNRFYHDYRVIVAAGSAAGNGVAALGPVIEGMDEPLKSKTITLSCGKLTTGVTVKPWTGIFMLRNCSTPETYFQAAFRVQSPWTVRNPDGVSPNRVEIIKKECYVFDFAPDRALRQIVEFSSARLDPTEMGPEQKVAEFLRFLPVLAYDDGVMEQIDATKILDFALSGTTATLLARKWESALLVNVDDDTLRRLIADTKALQALMNIEGFRTLNKDLETIVNQSGVVKKIQKEANDQELSQAKKKKLAEAEKEHRSLREQIQKKLIKFATRIPIFMYLTDYRERSLRDVITQLEPGLFRKVTGLTVRDFEALVSLGLFNSGRMNDAVYKFKRYEDASLVYTGIDKHAGERIGLYDTVITRSDASRAFEGMPPAADPAQRANGKRSRRGARTPRRADA